MEDSSSVLLEEEVVMLWCPFKLIGEMFDSRLRFVDQWKYVCQQEVIRLGALHKCKTVLSPVVKLKMVQVMGGSIIKYALIT